MLLKSAADARILVDRLGKVVESSYAAQHLFGYSAEEITGRMIASLIPDYFRIHQFQNRAQFNGQPEKRTTHQGKQLIALCRDGTKLQIDVDISVLQPPEYPYYFLLTICASNENWKRKQRISENAESQRAIIDQTIVGIVQTDLQGNLTQFNNRFCIITGFSRKQLLGKNLLGLTHPDDRQRHAELFQQLVSDNKPFTVEVRYLRKNKEISWVNLSISRICDASRNPCNCVAVVMDVTERMLTAQALQASEERLRQAERAANLGIFDVDLFNNSIHCNDRVLDIWGVSAEETLTYKSFLASIHPDDQEARDAAYIESIDPNGTGEYQLEYRVIHRRKKYTTWVSVTGRTLFENGQARRIVGIVQDISKRKHSEDKRQQVGGAMRTLLKQQVAAQTASAIAHELNQPLAAISAYSEVAHQALSGDSTNFDQLHRALQGSMEQAQRAGRTLHELLNFLQNNTIVNEALDINILIKDTVAMAHTYGFGEFSASIQLQPGLPPVLTNRLQTQMVLINLLRNGVDAMREAQTTPVSIIIKVQGIPEKGMAQVTVQDNGPGLNCENAKHIFEPFFTTKSTGIGMGLSISRSLIQANGGQLWFDVQDGTTGGVFHFTLPFAL